MILVDSSAWIELFRGSRSPIHLRLVTLIEGEAELSTTDVVVMEVLAGARTDEDGRRLRDALASFAYLPVHGPTDYLAAAELHRACRREGDTVRRLMDCLIAAVAIRAGAAVLSGDADFEVLARHTALELA